MTQRVGLRVLLCLLGLTTAVVPGTTLAAPLETTTHQAASTTLSPTEFGTRLFARINVRRTNRGCRKFVPNAALALAAQRHTDAMSSRNVLSHRLTGEADLGVRATQAGYTHWRIVAENLAWGQVSPRAVFRAWVNSPGHRANLDNCRLRDLGIGVVIRHGRPWVTADFGRRPS